MWHLVRSSIVLDCYYVSSDDNQLEDELGIKPSWSANIQILDLRKAKNNQLTHDSLYGVLAHSGEGQIV